MSDNNQEDNIYCGDLGDEQPTPSNATSGFVSNKGETVSVRRFIRTKGTHPECDGA